MALLAALLMLIPQDSGGRADLAAWERLDGPTFTSRKVLRFGSEPEARRYLASLETKGSLEQEGNDWKAIVPVIFDLPRRFLGRSLDPNERLIDGVQHKPTGRLFLKREEAEEFARVTPKVERVVEDSIDGRKAYSASWTDKIDLVAQARERLREEELCDPWILRPLPAPWTLTRYRLNPGNPTIHPATAVKEVDVEVEAPGRPGVSYQAQLFSPDPQIEHQVLGKPLYGNWSLRRTEQGTVIFQEGATGWFLTWKHREGVFLRLSGFDPESPDLVAACLRRFPSAWPKEFELDRQAWVRTEVDYRLRRMKETLDADPRPGHRWLPYNIEFGELVRWVDAPFVGDLAELPPPEVRRQHYQNITAWWLETGRDAAPRKRPLTNNELRSLSARKK